jgi:hypothetical protein
MRATLPDALTEYEPNEKQGRTVPNKHGSFFMCAFSVKPQSLFYVLGFSRLFKICTAFLCAYFCLFLQHQTEGGRETRHPQRDMLGTETVLSANLSQVKNC